jgi:hypothetical protein
MIREFKRQLKLPGKQRTIRDLAVQIRKQKTMEGTRQMKLEINVPVSGLDLASLLDGEQGLFLCQNRGQNYITVAKAGHSIAFGPTPIGKAIQEQMATSLGPEPWFITKISNSTELAEFRGNLYGREAR